MSQGEPLPDEPRELTPVEPQGSHVRGSSDALPALRIPVWLAHRLRRLPLPLAEVAEARVRVEQRVFSAIPHTTSRLAANRRRKRVAFAIVLTVFSAVAWVSALAASASPSSPLYAVKRGEEWVAYQTAWSHGRRGDVLLMAAHRRLNEAETIADEHEGTAVDLALDLRGNLLELIGLYQTMNIVHATSAETRAIEAGLTRMLQEQSDAAANAELAGKRLLATALRENARLARDALAQRHLTLP